MHVLQDLLKHTPKDHPDFPLLQDALRISQNFLSSINEEIDPRRTAVTTPKGEVCVIISKSKWHFTRAKVISIVYALRAQQEVTSGVLLGPSAGEGWLPGGGVGKLQKVTARLPLYRSAALCQDEKDFCRVSPLYLFLSIQIIKTVYSPQSHLNVHSFRIIPSMFLSIYLHVIRFSFHISTSTEPERMTPALHKRSCLSFCFWLCKARGLFEASLTKRKTSRHFA